MALRTLYADGGIPRFYRGLLPALVQGPLSRFGDTAANTGILTLLDNLEQTQNMAVGVKTIAASAAAAIFRIGLMPIDTVKTVGFCRVLVFLVLHFLNNGSHSDNGRFNNAKLFRRCKLPVNLAPWWTN